MNYSKFSLVHSAAHPEIRDRESAQGVLGKWLVGDTLALKGKKGLYGVDFPTVRGGRIHMTERTLRSKLGSREESGVVFSNDGSVRFTPYDDLQTGEMTVGQFAFNRGVAVVHGGFENAMLLAQASSLYKVKPYFACAKKAPEKPEIKVPGVCADSILYGGLGVNCSGSSGGGLWYSFGVRCDTGEARAPKK